NDRAYGPAFTRRVRAMGIRDRPISPRSPWQNAYVERLIGTLRRDCLDHVLIFHERHLRRVLTLYSLYYNETRTHLGLGKDAPLRRAVRRSGTIVATPILSALHHRFGRMWFSGRTAGAASRFGSACSSLLLRGRRFEYGERKDQVVEGRLRRGPGAAVADDLAGLLLLDPHAGVLGPFLFRLTAIRPAHLVDVPAQQPLLGRHKIVAYVVFELRQPPGAQHRHHIAVVQNRTSAADAYVTSLPRLSLAVDQLELEAALAGDREGVGRDDLLPVPEDGWRTRRIFRGSAADHGLLDGEARLSVVVAHSRALRVPNALQQ